MRVKVRLYGHLRERFGADFEFEVDSLAEICSAMLPANLDGFREHLIERSDPGYWVIVNGEVVRREDLEHRTYEDATVQIVPAIRGAADGKAVGSVIGGIALIIGGIFTFGATTIAGIAVSAATSSAIASGAIGLGLSLTMGGVSSMLTSDQDTLTGTGEKTKSLLNSAASGAGINTAGQGQYKAIRFGRQAVAGIPISTRVIIRHDAG